MPVDLKKYPVGNCGYPKELPYDPSGKEEQEADCFDTTGIEPNKATVRPRRYDEKGNLLCIECLTPCGNK